MREKIGKHYFVVAKLVGLLLLLGYEIIQNTDSVMLKALHGLYLAMFLLASVGMELSDRKTKKRVLWALSGILTVFGWVFYPTSGCILGILWIGDFCSIFPVPQQSYLLMYLMWIPINKVYGGFGKGLVWITFLLMIYYQEKVIINGYRSFLGMEEVTQNELKTDLERQHRHHQKEMQRSHLQFENEILQERNRISQALHDKLGHSINGSLYQLEAAKLLVEKKPEECRRILQVVIDQLRQSMDEIRSILRSERPEKKRMAQLALQSLCEECESQYQIQASLKIEDKEGRIPEKIWEIILDNTYEAVTNALKYANCHRIAIEILAMNEVVRCTISDDGRGADSVEEGMGIAGMKDRVRAVKGFIGIESEAGFRINMILPIGK